MFDFFAIRLLSAALFGLTLASCSLSPAVQNNSLDYDNVIEDVANRSLITNVLRGKDRAPLYFPDLAIVRGSISASTSIQSSFPYVPGPLQIGPLAAGSNPSFDIAPSNTKQFYQGVMNPVSKAIFEYYVERDHAASSFGPAFFMLVNAIDITKDGVTRTYRVGDEDHKYLRLASQWIYGSEPIKILKTPAKKGIEVAIDAKSLVEANTAGLDISVSSPGRVRIAKKSPSVVICVHSDDDGGYVPIDIEENSTVKEPTGDDLHPSKDSLNACKGLGGRVVKSPARYKLHLRSVEQLFYYLGDVVRTGGSTWARGDTAETRRIGCSPLSFHVFDEPIAHPRFSVEYRGHTYFVAEYGTLVPCPGVDLDGQPNTQYDNTVALLVILNDLLNLNRDANEIPTTKAVTAVGSKS